MKHFTNILINMSSCGDKYDKFAVVSYLKHLSKTEVSTHKPKNRK